MPGGKRAGFGILFNTNLLDPCIKRVGEFREVFRGQTLSLLCQFPFFDHKLFFDPTVFLCKRKCVGFDLFGAACAKSRFKKQPVLIDCQDGRLGLGRLRLHRTCQKNDRCQRDGAGPQH